jgi:hypothetical protein
MTSKRATILDNLKNLLTTQCGSWAKKIDWEKIRILLSDFGEHELPLIQFYHVRTDYEQQQGRVQARMVLNIEICLKSTVSGTINQKDLFDKMDLVLQGIGTNPNFGVPGVIHARLLSDETDTHTLDGIFVGILVWEIIYLTTYTGC